MKWIKETYKEIKRDLDSKLKPWISWVSTPIALITIIVCVLMVPIILLSLVLGKYLIDPAFKLLERVFTKETP